MFWDTKCNGVGLEEERSADDLSVGVITEDGELDKDEEGIEFGIAGWLGVCTKRLHRQWTWLLIFLFEFGELLS